MVVASVVGARSADAPTCRISWVTLPAYCASERLGSVDAELRDSAELARDVASGTLRQRRDPSSSPTYPPATDQVEDASTPHSRAASQRFQDGFQADGVPRGSHGTREDLHGATGD